MGPDPLLTVVVVAQEPIPAQSINRTMTAARGGRTRQGFAGGEGARGASTAVKGTGKPGFSVDIPIPESIVPETQTLRKGVKPMEEQVKKALDQVRGSLQADGGDVEFVEITEDGVVKVKLVGSCAGCPMSQMTLMQGIERYLKSQIPEVKEVVSV